MNIMVYIIYFTNIINMESTICYDFQSDTERNYFCNLSEKMNIHRDIQNKEYDEYKKN